MTDDRSLFAAISLSDENAFKMLFNRHRLMVYGAAIRYTKSSSAAEDITQEVFIRLWEKRHLLADIHDPKAYICKSTFNFTKNFLQHSQVRSKAILSLAQQPAESSNSTLEQLEAKELQARLSTAIEKLSPQKQLIYNLSKIIGKSYKEIAAQLQISPETVRSHLYETMKFIRHYLKSGLVIGLWLLLSHTY